MKSSRAYVNVNATIKIRDSQFFVRNNFSKQADVLMTTGEIFDAFSTLFGRKKAGMCFRWKIYISRVPAVLIFRTKESENRKEKNIAEV